MMKIKKAIEKATKNLSQSRSCIIEKQQFENEILVRKVLSFEPKQAAVANLLARGMSVCEQT